MKARSLLPAAAALLAVAIPAPAATYYWKAPDATWGDWTDLSNWSTESATGLDATVLPGASDRLFGNVGEGTTRQFDLAGGERTIEGWSSNANDNWLRHNLRFRNGALLVAGDVSTHSDTVHLDAGASLVLSSNTTYTASFGHAGADQWRVHPGASLSFLGSLKIYKADVEVDEGATFVLDPRSFGFTGNPNQTSYIHNSGTLSLPSGLAFSSGANDATFRIRQLAGTLSVGGDVSDGGKAGAYELTLEGGTVAATADARFSFGTMSIPAGAALTNDVAAGATLDLSAFAISPGVVLAKSGAGRLALPAFPDTLDFRGGSVAVPATATTAGRLVVESGASFETPCKRLAVSDLSLRGNLAITKPGLVVSSGGGTGTVTVDLAAFHEGDLVLSTDRSDLRAKARAAAEAAAAGTGLSIEETGNEVRVAVNPGTYVFDSTAVTDMSDPAGWLGGAVPPAGADRILVSGAGVVAELTAACPAWDSIEALDATTLRLARAPGATALRFEPTASLVVGGGVALALAETPGTESIRLEEGASLSVAPGATVALGAGFAGTASATNLPALSVPADATLRVPGGFGFKNVALSASGTIEAASAGGLAFGTASAGETAWFGLALDGATVSVPDGDVCFADPDAGGTVKAAGTWLVRGTAFDHGDSTGFNFARNNPTSEVVEIVFDGTVLSWTTGKSAAGGGVHATFRNGAQFYRNNVSRQKDTALAFRGRATFEFLEGTRFKFGCAQTSSGLGVACAVRPDEDGHVPLVFDGAVWEVFRSSGGGGVVGSNGKGVVKVRGESLREITYHPGWGWQNPFSDLKEVLLDEGAALTIVVGPYRKDGSGQEGRQLPQTVAQPVPFTGAGSLCFSNATPATARAYAISRSDNSATGTLSAAAACNAKVVLGPGANWAGTVVWDGGVELTVADDETPFSYALGGLRLEEPFAFRLWEGGACDRVDLAGEGWTGASGLVFRPMGGLVPEAGDEWVLGTMPAGTAPPISANARWVLSTRPVEGNADAVQLVVTATGASFVFFSDGTADLNDPDGWLCGYVPVGQDVVVAGIGVAPVVTSSAPLPSFASIVVRDGASLAVRDSCALPDVRMEPGTALEVSGAGTTASLASFSAGAPTPGGAPAATVRVGEGATLAPAADTAFRNVRMELLAGSTLAGGGNLSLGWAGAGETAVFGLAATNAAISTAGNGSLGLACPAAGGRVVPLGPFSLSGCALDTRLGWVRFCENNPTNEPVEFVLDRTDLAAKGTSDNPGCGVLVAGAALVRMENGSAMCRDTPSNPQYGDYRPTFRQRGRMVFSGTHAALPAEIRAPFCGNGDAQACFAPDEDGWPSLELRGSRAWLWMNKLVGTGSNGRAVLKAADASFVFGMVYWYGQRPYFLHGLKAVEIEEGTTLEMVRRRLGAPWTVGDSAVGGASDDAAGRETLVLAEVPFAGGGSLVIANALEKPFHVLLQSGGNTAAGTLSVHDAVPGGTNAWLLVNDGANWAGTVVADGNVRLVHAADGNTDNGRFYFEDTGEPAAVSFGGLECRRDFPVRVWGAGTRTYAKTGARNDRIHFGTTGFLARGGRLVVEPQEGCEPATGSKWWFGTIPAGTPDPSVKGRWRFVRRPSPTPGVDDLWLVHGKSTLVIFK